MSKLAANIRESFCPNCTHVGKVRRFSPNREETERALSVISNVCNKHIKNWSLAASIIEKANTDRLKVSENNISPK